MTGGSEGAISPVSFHYQPEQVSHRGPLVSTLEVEGTAARSPGQGRVEFGVRGELAQLRSLHEEATTGMYQLFPFTVRAAVSRHPRPLSYIDP